MRYDGSDKRDAFLVETLGPLVEWVPVCPEVELGLDTPREAMRLERRAGTVRMVFTDTGRDITDDMRAFARARVEALARERLSGYVLKKGSPSCGMERLPVFDESGVADESGRGLFAEALFARFPDLPIEDEGRLSEPRLRERFIERVFAYARRYRSSPVFRQPCPSTRPD